MVKKKSILNLYKLNAIWRGMTKFNTTRVLGLRDYDDVNETTTLKSNQNST